MDKGVISVLARATASRLGSLPDADRHGLVMWPIADQVNDMITATIALVDDEDTAKLLPKKFENRGNNFGEAYNYQVEIAALQLADLIDHSI